MKTTQRRLLWVVDVMLSITLLVSLFISAPVCAQTIKIGVLYSSTGAFAGFGKPSLRATLLAFEQANAAGGIKGQQIETIVYDAESNPDQAARQAKKLILRDKVVAIIGPEVWRVATLMYALAIEHKIPIFTCLAIPGLFPAEQVTWTFPFTAGADTNLFGTMYYFKSLGVKRLVFFGTADPIGDKLIKDINSEGSKLGMTLVGVQLAPIASTDVTPQMAVLKEKKPDALIVNGSGPFGNMAMNNASQIGMNIPAAFVTANTIPAYMAGLGAGAEKNLRAALHKAVVYSELDEKDSAKPRITAFANAYRAKYAEEINYASAVAYDGGRMVVEALEAAGPDPQGIKKYMDGMKNWEGPGTGRRMTMLPEYHYIQADFRDLIVVRWDAGEKSFRKVVYVRDTLK